MELVFLNILLAGVGLLLFLFIRALPRMDDMAALDRRSVFERWLTSRLPEKIDILLHALFLRTLRRIKVLTLRLDNGINQRLQRMKFAGGDNIKNEKIDFKKVISRDSDSLQED